MRQFLCILLLICLPLQSFALQVGVDQPLTSLGWAHEPAHSDDPHHHAEDGAAHYDESDESLAHADEHSAGLQLSILNINGFFFGATPASPGQYLDPASYIPDPFLDEPQRPPAFAPGLAAGG